MSLKTVMENSFVMKIAYTVAASAIIGGGTVVLHNQSQLAVLESVKMTQEARLERIENKLDLLIERLTEATERHR